MGEVKRWLNLFYGKMEDAWTFLYLFILTQMKDFIVKKEKKTMAKADPHILTLT